jgi:hypothetical protein
MQILLDVKTEDLDDELTDALVLLWEARHITKEGEPNGQSSVGV